MKKSHLANIFGQPECTTARNKKFEVVDDPAEVDCKNCLRLIRNAKTLQMIKHYTN